MPGLHHRAMKSSLLLLVAIAGCNHSSGGSEPTGMQGSAQSCPPGTVVCGNGCIPQAPDAVCCEAAGAAGSSYCTNGAGGGCFPNDAGTCMAAFPSNTVAQFCCSQNGSFGSNDCPPGQHHCGLLCQSGPCGDGGASGSSSGGQGGGTTCVLDGSRCQAGAVCCNGLILDATDPTNCRCTYPIGHECHGLGLVTVGPADAGTTGCCANTHGLRSSEGTVVGTCDQATTNTCSTDSDCYTGYECKPWPDGGPNGPMGDACMDACCVVGESSDCVTGLGCCDGLVVANGACRLPPGVTCYSDIECASSSCVRGTTTATCQ